MRDVPLRPIIAVTLLTLAFTTTAPAADADPVCPWRGEQAVRTWVCVDPDSGEMRACADDKTPDGRTCAVDGGVPEPSAEDVPETCATPATGPAPTGCGRAGIASDGEPCVSRHGPDSPCRTLSVTTENVHGAGGAGFTIHDPDCSASSTGRESCTWDTTFSAWGIGKKPGTWRVVATANLNEVRCWLLCGEDPIPGSEITITCTFDGEDALLHDEGCADAVAGITVDTWCDGDRSRGVSQTWEYWVYSTSPVTGLEKEERHESLLSDPLSPDCPEA